MNRYKDNYFLIFINIIAEYVLLVATYFVCGYIRMMVPRTIGKKFNDVTIVKYTPFILLVALLMVIIYLVMGDYLSIHFKNTKWIVKEAFIVSFTAGVVSASMLFFVEGYPFSRILLIMVVLAWTVVISVKRRLVEYIANKVFADKIRAYKVLLLGKGSDARRYYEGLKKDSSTRYEFIGYLAPEENKYIPQYLGDYDKLYETISALQGGKVVIAEENPNKKLLKEILTICGVFGVEAVIIPTFSEYISNGQSAKSEYDIRCFTVNAYNTSNILGVNVSVTDMDKTVTDIEDNLEKWRGKYICVSNVHTTVMAHDNPEYLKVQNGAVMALPDGGPLSSYSRSEGRTEAKRVTGPDLMREILKQSGEHGWKHFFYGSTDKTLEMLKEKIERDYSGAEVVGMISPPFRELSPEEDTEYINMINEAKPDFVWVGLGAPKQEIWMAAHQDRINALMIGVGAAFDYESGNLKRAPKWMQKCNLEWLYRFMQEPKRLFKRYFVTNLKFLWLTRR